MNTPTNEALLKKIDEAPLLMSKEAARKKLRKPRSIYGDQILFMLAITVIATCFYGWRVVVVCLLGVYLHTYRYGGLFSVKERIRRKGLIDYRLRYGAGAYVACKCRILYSDNRRCACNYR